MANPYFLDPNKLNEVMNAAQAKQEAEARAEAKAKAPEIHWRRVGMIALSTGLVWIGDSFHIATPPGDPARASAFGNSFRDFEARVQRSLDRVTRLHTELRYDNTARGLGIVIAADRYANYLYPVEVGYIPEGAWGVERLVQARIRFDEPHPLR